MSPYRFDFGTSYWTQCVRWLAACSIVVAMIGCALLPTSVQTPHLAPVTSWSGRLSVTLESDPPQSYWASFNLEGNADTGRLRLSSPLGSTLATMSWNPKQAVLRQGNQERSFASLEDMAQQMTGTALPVRALFAWLHGWPQSYEGWQADLDQLQDGRLTARRLQPQPAAELRLLLDQ